MRWAREASWGDLPPVPDWRCIPIQSGVMGLKAEASLFWPPTSFAGWKRSVLLPELQRAAGPVEVLAWPQVVGYVLDAALERNAQGDLHSYCVDYFTPPDPRRYRGAVVESLQIRADRTAVALLLRTRAWKEEENDALAEDDFDYLDLTSVPFRMRDARVALDGIGVTDVEEFAVTVDNEVRPGPCEAGHVAFLIGGRRCVRLEARKLNNTDDFNAAIRTGAPLSFEAEFTHPDDHRLTLELPALFAERSAEDGAPSRVASSQTLLRAATDESGHDLTYGVYVSGLTTTTTTAP